MKISKEVFVAMLAEEIGITKKLAEELYRGYGVVAKSVLMQGVDVPIYEVGHLTTKKFNPKEPCWTMINPKTGEMGMSEFRDLFYAPHFRAKETFKKEMKEATYGKGFELDLDGEGR